MLRPERWRWTISTRLSELEKLRWSPAVYSAAERGLTSEIDEAFDAWTDDGDDTQLIILYFKAGNSQPLYDAILDGAIKPDSPLAHFVIEVLEGRVTRTKEDSSRFKKHLILTVVGIWLELLAEWRQDPESFGGPDGALLDGRRARSVEEVYAATAEWLGFSESDVAQVVKRNRRRLGGQSPFTIVP